MTSPASPRPQPRAQETVRDLSPVGIPLEGLEMFLHFGALGEALVQMHGLSLDLLPAIRMRLTYFQSRGFPLADAGRGKARIGMDDTLKVAFAFELLATGITPQRAMRLTATDWPVIAPAIAEAWRAVRAGIEAPVLAITPEALAEVAADDQGPSKPLSEVIGAFAPADAGQAGEGRAVLIMRVGAMVERMETCMDKPAGPRLDKISSPGAFGRAMDAYCTTMLGAEQPAEVDNCVDVDGKTVIGPSAPAPLAPHEDRRPR